MKTVGVINYGVGNLGSICSAIEGVGAIPRLVEDPMHLKNLDLLVLPGVGNYANCMEMLNAVGWSNAIKDEVLGCNRPILGICVGMQLLADSGYEGVDIKIHPNGMPGLGLITGAIKNMMILGCDMKVPHVGWNSVKILNAENSLFSNIPNNTDYYFVHSYSLETQKKEQVLAVFNYGSKEFVAAVSNENIWGTQFHPEKSSKAGLRLLHNFISRTLC